MIFRRRRADAECERVEAARESIQRHAPDSGALAVLDQIEAGLTEARADHARLAETLAGLDPDGATRELKAALRGRPGPLEADTPQIASLRQRHHTVHALRNRMDELSLQIDRTLVDVDTLAAQSATASIGSSGAMGLDEQLRRLTQDAANLEAAHRELGSIT